MRKLLLYAIAALTLTACNQKQTPAIFQTLSDENSILFEEPCEISYDECYTVFRTVDGSHGLANSEFVEPKTVLVETEDLCYDGLEYCMNDSMTFGMVGVYSYVDGFWGEKTVPIIRLVENKEEEVE
jgi:hypothetical protein